MTALKYVNEGMRVTALDNLGNRVKGRVIVAMGNRAHIKFEGYPARDYYLSELRDLRLDTDTEGDQA